MYELKRTHARAVFKQLLGQANHFLITILVGLNGVRDGRVTVDEEFRTSWNPVSAKISAERSRFFALDLALVRAIDSLDTFMMLSNRRPLAIFDDGFRRAMDGAGRSVARRLDVFQANLAPLPDYDVVFLKFAIEWRNARVHSLAEDPFTNAERDLLLMNTGALNAKHSGLNIAESLKRFEQRDLPHFKDAASIIRAVQDAVKHYDSELLKAMNLEVYVRRLLTEMLRGTHGNKERNLRHSCEKIWGESKKREQKAIRMLRMVGVDVPSGKKKGCSVPDDFVETIKTMTCAEAVSYFSQGQTD